MGHIFFRGLERFRTPLFAFWIAELVVVGYYSLMPGKTLGTVPGSDKLWHCAGYLLLALPVPFLFARTARRLQAAVGLVFFGGLLEFLQGFVPGRSVEAADLLANTCGVILGLAIPVLLGLGWSSRPLRIGTD